MDDVHVNKTLVSNKSLRCKTYIKLDFFLSVILIDKLSPPSN